MPVLGVSLVTFAVAITKNVPSDQARLLKVLSAAVGRGPCGIADFGLKNPVNPACPVECEAYSSWVNPV